MTLVVETARLLLRPPLLEDFDRWAEMMADAEAARFLGGVQAKSVVWRTLMALAGAWALTGVAMFSVVERATGRWVGRVGPWHPYGWPGTEVGWGLHPEAWGRGYATEAATAAMDYAVERLGWTEIVHTIDPANMGSKRVASRLGSVLLGLTRLPVPHEALEMELWGQSAAAWRLRDLRSPDGLGVAGDQARRANP